jgi:hypothetical protein
MTRSVTIRVAALVAIGALPLGCESDSPTAPSRTVLSVAASPTTIRTDQTSTITIAGFKPDGNPLSPGTELFATTTLGTLTLPGETDELFDNGVEIS